MRKSILMFFIPVLICSVVLTFSLIGCNGEQEAEEVEDSFIEQEAEEEEAQEAEEDTEEAFPSSISGTVYTMIPWTGGAYAEGVELVAEKFRQEYPDIELNMVPKSGEEAWTSTLANLTSDKPWDTLVYWPKGYSQPLVDQGLIAPLTEIFEITNFDEIAPGAYDIARYRGTEDVPYNIPINSHMFSVFYNVEKFEEAGIEEVPETWDEFLHVCQTLMDNDIYPIGKNTGHRGAAHLSWFDKFMTRTLPDDTYRSQLMIGEADWDTPEFRNADNYWDDVMPFWHPNSSTAEYADVYAMFARGDIAMQVIGSWVIGSYEAEMGMEPLVDYDTFLFPQIDSDIPLAETVSSNCIMLSEAKKDNEAAQAWIAFWCRPEISALFNDYVSNVSPISSVTLDHPILHKLGEESAGRPLYFQWLMDTEVHNLVDTEFEARSLGMITQDEEIENLNEIIEDWKESSE